MKQSNPLQVLFGLGLMVMIATAPIQVVVAAEIEPPHWLAVALAFGSTTAGLGALGAAYFSLQQAQQVNRSRRADLYHPPIVEATLSAQRLVEKIAELMILHPGADRQDPTQAVTEEAHELSKIGLRLMNVDMALTDKMQELSTDTTKLAFEEYGKNDADRSSEVWNQMLSRISNLGAELSDYEQELAD